MLYYEFSDNLLSLSHILLYIGCSIYVLIILILTLLYLYSDSNIAAQPQYDSLNKHTLYRCSILGMSWIWSIYPAIVILYISNILNIYNTILSFLLLDFVSKFWNSFLTTGYELYKYNIKTAHTRLLQLSAKIHPLEFPSTVPEPGEAEYTLSAVPNITDDTITPLANSSPSPF